MMKAGKCKVPFSLRLKDLLGPVPRVKKKKKCQVPPTLTITPNPRISELRFTLTETLQKGSLSSVGRLIAKGEGERRLQGTPHSLGGMLINGSCVHMKDPVRFGVPAAERGVPGTPLTLNHAH